MFRVNVHHVRTVAQMIVTTEGGGWQQFMVGVEEIIHIAVRRLTACGGGGLFYPLLRN